jgi:hypothetical protein
MAATALLALGTVETEALGEVDVTAPGETLDVALASVVLGLGDALALAPVELALGPGPLLGVAALVPAAALVLEMTTGELPG